MQEIDQVAQRIEETISSPDCILGHLDTVRRVVQEIEVGESMPITRPEVVIDRNDLDVISEAVIGGLLQRCDTLRKGRPLHPMERPRQYVTTRSLLHNFYGRLSDVNLTRVEVPAEYVDQTTRRYKTADPDSFARYELSVEAQPTGKDRMYSAIGFTAFVKNFQTKGSYSGSKAIVTLNEVMRGAEVRDRVNASALRAAVLESQNLADPYSGGLPGLRR